MEYLEAINLGFLTFIACKNILEAGSPRSRCGHSLFLLRALSLAGRWPASLCLRVLFSLCLSVCRALLLIGHQSSWVRAHPRAQPKDLVLTFSLKTLSKYSYISRHWGLGFQHMNCVGAQFGPQQ